MRSIRSLLAATLLLLIAAPIVSAHAELESRTPRPNATVPSGPVEIIARFNEALDAGRSRIDLRDGAGTNVARGSVDGRDLRIGLEGLLPGEYEVRWTAAGSDDHVERGNWRFTVAAAPSPSPSAAPTDEPSESPSAAASPSEGVGPPPSPAPSPSPPPDPGATASGGDVLLPIVAALVIVIGGLAALLLRGRRSP